MYASHSKKDFLPVRDRSNSSKFADKLKMWTTDFCEFFFSGGINQMEQKNSILVLIQIRIRVQEF